MKKIASFLVLFIIIISSFSCGPRRYKCGPYRRCEIKENVINPKKNIEIDKIKLS